MSDAPAEQNRTKQNHPEHVKNDRTIPAPDPSWGLTFTATLTLKQCTGEIQHFLLSFNCQTTNYATEGLGVLDFLVRHYKTDIVITLWWSGKLLLWLQLLSRTRLWFNMIKKYLVLSSVFPKNAIPLSKTQQLCCHKELSRKFKTVGDSSMLKTEDLWYYVYVHIRWLSGFHLGKLFQNVDVAFLRHPALPGGCSPWFLLARAPQWAGPGTDCWQVDSSWGPWSSEKKPPGLQRTSCSHQSLQQGLLGCN